MDLGKDSKLHRIQSLELKTWNLLQHNKYDKVIQQESQSCSPG